MSLFGAVRGLLFRCQSVLSGVPDGAGFKTSGQSAQCKELETSFCSLGARDQERVLAALKCIASGAEDEFTRYRVAELIAESVYPKFKFSEFGRSFLDDEEFFSYYKRIMDVDNWHSADRKYTLREFLKLVSHIDADIAECGCYRGASAYLMCKAAANCTVHLFDSFEGLNKPELIDGKYWSEGALSTSLDSLRSTLAEFDNFFVYKGWIPEKFHEVSSRAFKFVHIDVDLYRPTLESLRFFYPRIVSGGLIVMDDYGFISCPGAKSAADEFFDGKPERIVMLPTGQAFVIKI